MGIQTKTLVISTALGVLVGAASGAIAATYLFRASTGSPGDLQVRQVQQLRELLVHDGGLISAEDGQRRTVSELANWMVVAASSYPAISMDSERQSLIRASEWILANDVFGSSNGNKAYEWAGIAAQCVVDNSSNPENVALCAQKAKPEGFAGGRSESI